MSNSSSETDTAPFAGFLASEVSISSPENSFFHIIPVPFEKSVSYGTGTANGPAAILQASQQLEFFDTISCPGEKGIHTHHPIKTDTPEAMVGAVSKTVGSVVENNQIPVVIGGEHTVSLGAVMGMEKHQPFGVVQIDAHADLRDSYEGSPYSHACVMRRIVDLGIPIFQIGIRSLSLEEVAFRKKKKIRYLDMMAIHANGLPADILPDDFPERLYLTIDVDGLDPSIMPATGTPEPGGLSWQQTMTILENLARTRQIIGFDAVETAPIGGMHFPEYTVARMIYNLMGFIARNR
jgi:agmatinase